MLTRRRFLQFSSGTMVLAAMPLRSRAAGGREYRLVAAPAKASLVEEATLKTDVWAYNGSCPGPVLRARKGEQITIHVTNQLDQPTTVHWHGMRIDNAMDGVAHLTQEPIPTGQTFTYRFTPPDAGTYWYHPHNRSWEQMARGLYGALIVEGDADTVSFDHDHVVVADDWRLDGNGLLDEASFGHMMDWSHAGRLGNVMTANGQAYARLPVVPGGRVRLRIINSANSRIMRFAIQGHAPHVLALDGQPIKPVPLEKPGITLAPSQRVDLGFTVKGEAGDEIAIVETSSGENLVAGYLVCQEGTVAAGDVEIQELGHNPVAPPDLDNAFGFRLNMEGGAMRFLQSAVYEGKELDGRTLAMEHGQFWAFNGVAGMTEKPMLSVERGRTVRMTIDNNTLWPHAIHLHGHHFRVLSRGIVGSGLQDVSSVDDSGLRDTVLLERQESVEIAFVADNPGKWMLHCHMLEHQAAGMAAWFEVT